MRARVAQPSSAVVATAPARVPAARPRSPSPTPSEAESMEPLREVGPTWGFEFSRLPLFCSRATPAAPSGGGMAVSQPGDALEREAEQVADAVMRAGERAAPDPVSHAPPLIQRACAACREEEEPAQAQRRAEGATAPTAAPEVSAMVRALRGGGSPLPAPTRAFMEERFGYDFGGVRIHTSGQAHAAARALSAHAFTVGGDIYFAAGAYAPHSQTGRRLLAHELTHVVQQRGQAGGAARSLIQRATTRGAGGCGPLREVDEDNRGARGAGLTAHTQLQSFLLGSGVLSELTIPRATKELLSSQGCQPEGVEAGRADLYRPGNLVGLAEIKPFGFAQTYGVEQVEHYIRRARQSMDRIHHSSSGGPGGCGDQPRGADDDAFARRIGTSPAVRTEFHRMTGILQNDTIIGAFDGDRTRTLKARLVAPGAVGYWCTGGQSDTFSCGGSEREMNDFIDRALLPAQDVLTRFLDDVVGPRLDRLVDRMSLAAIFAAAERVGGERIRQVLGPELGVLLTLVPGQSLTSIGAFLESQISPALRSVMRTLARRLVSIILNELRVQLRNSLRTILQETLNALCVGATVVTLAQLLDALTEALRNKARQLAPAVVGTAVAAFARAILSELATMLGQMLSALGEALAWVLEGVLRVLAALALAILAVGVVVVAVLAFLAIFDPVPGDEVALGAAATAMAALLPVLLRYVRTGDTGEPEGA
ncbi:DUF4157 domain-containing protein [Myxococcus fulvus]|uniref:eCIS core domain-containing protein n=1 Tax=Myxococcus fulvus TaxID=33 RepID=UPI0020BFAE28|nr:DUF4157 domain-containing protein [Myxococcus fulvus]MCK8496676.1 DUF4157 domain-containing protein [Myxococcus fulvus]